MPSPFEHLRPHRRLIAFLETALDAIEEALLVNATVGVLPHWAEGQVKEMAETLAALLGHLEHEGQHLAPLSAEEWGVEEAADEDC
jgi:hypothetical protein